MTQTDSIRHAMDWNNIEVMKLFPTPLAMIEHPDATNLNERLKAVILAREAAHGGVAHSNMGGWQSTSDFIVWSGEPGAELVAFTKTFADSLTMILDPQQGLIQQPLDWHFNAWANVAREGCYNVPHSHPGSYWSGVYWVDDGLDGDEQDLGGEIEFLDPRGAMPIMFSPELKMGIEDCLFAGLRQPMKPRPGTLAMFPSWLMHSVSSFFGSKPRISIAINLLPPFRLNA